MNGVEFFRSGEELIAIVVRRGAQSENKYNFLTDDREPFQLGMSFYSPGERIRSHAHLPRTIRVSRVQEFIVLSHGRARLDLYSETRARIAQTLLEAGDVVLLLGGGHGFEILEDTRIVEVKQGPYEGAKNDKEVFE